MIGPSLPFVSRLAQQWPSAAAVFAGLSLGIQQQVVRRAVETALSEASSTPPVDESKASLEAEVERLDDEAGELQDTAGYEAAFRRARAINALLVARYENDPADALYEAFHALGAEDRLDEFLPTA